MVILDNLSSHKSAKAAALLKDIGAWFLPLPPYSPDPCAAKNSPPGLFSLRASPIEMAFAKLKTPIRKAAARTEDTPWQAVSHVCDPFTADECYNDFKAAGYEAN